MIKKLLARLGVIQLVYTVDFDGTVRLRRVYRHYESGYSCAAICDFSEGHKYDVRLLPGNKTGGANYVKKWFNYPGNRETVVIND